MKCLRCGNENPAAFFWHQDQWYCRRCLDFGILQADTAPRQPKLKKKTVFIQPNLEFELTDFQKSVSEKALRILKSGRDVFVYAAAGAGKTEISLESICWYLSQGKKVCFAISRRQVVLEICTRLQKCFPSLEVIPVCQGYTQKTDGDLIVCTTHQLYRYPSCFDLLILDELDAFPFAGNPVLEKMADDSCKGQKMLLSATPDAKSLQQIRMGKMEMVQLFRRPHGRPLCVPKRIYAGCFSQTIRIFIKCLNLIHSEKQVLVYVPRIADTWWMKAVLSLAGKCAGIHSSSKDRDAVMERFRRKEIQILVCTTLLERGITVPSVQVLVYRADHPVFTTASLIQIFGRVGRTFQDPQGEGICYMESFSSQVEECCRQIEQMNSTAFYASR